MSTVVKDLGAVSAYAYAVEKGYTGTEAEFAELMADYAEVGQRAEDAADSALESKTAAQTAATTATNKASEATTAATTATTKAAEASTSASTATSAKDTAVSAASTATTKATEATTAAATATSAKTDAVAANTAAQSAKTAAQTAQTGAETAAASVSASAAQIATNAEDISQLKSEFAGIFSTSEIEATTQIDQITGINKRTGWNASDGSSSIAMSSNANYDSYWFVTSKDIDVWFGSISAGYFAFIVGGTFQSTQEQSASSFYIFCQNGSTRYRKSDNNLPTENNKMHIPSGCAVAFTITAGAMESIHGVDVVEVKGVKESFKEQIVKTNFLRYINSTGADESTERVEIYIPTVSGYIRYDLVHTESATRNADVWRISNAYHTTDSFVVDYGLTTSGEWECAVKLDGRSDFSGGHAHGDEIMNNILFIVDGATADITSFTNLTAFTDLTVIQDSTFYDPADGTTAFASHGSEHRFGVDGMVIKQSLLFSASEIVNTLYMAMLPIAKTVSNKVVPNNTFVPLDTNSAIRIYNTDDVTVYKSDGKVKAVFSVPVWELLNPDVFTFMCLDNGGTEYNKCYFCNTLGNTSIASGKLIKSVTKYNFVVSA